MIKLLVVDDDDALRRLMRLQLGDAYQIIDSGEPEQGLALALEHKPDAILLDLRMPKYSGYDLCQTFTSFSRTHGVPVIVVSGEAGADIKERCKELGAAAYFEKPIDFEALRECLGRIVKKRRSIPPADVTVRLHVSLELRGTDSQNRKFEEVATTENVSLNGFQCGCKVQVAVGSIVDVYLTSPGKEHVGKAQIVHADMKSGPLRVYGCRFTRKTGAWVLR